jgi:Holliday junction resolvase RusA-like endonuclease
MKYTIPGRPIPLQRPRFNPNGKRPWDPQKSIKKQIGTILAAQNKLRLLYEGPLELEVTFYFPAPIKSMYGKWYKARPDTSNLIKLVEDAAQGILFTDDCLICSIVARKLYADYGRTEFTLRELTI